MKMMGVIVGLILSWILLWLVQNQNILALGFAPVGVRFLQMVLGFFFSSMVCASSQLAEAAMLHAHWQLNPKIDFAHIYDYFWWNFNSIMFEELLFRGALLFIAIKRLGYVKGIFLSAIAFGIYHWFSYGVFGNPVPMIVVFLITALMGWVWAYAFAKTKSMALPIGFHLGWNFTFNAIFSKGFISYPVFMLIKAADNTGLEGFASLTNFLLQNLLPPVLTFIFIKFCFKEKSKVPVDEETKPHYSL
jgi:membrane protease YdiL (CAAX protease family)